MANANVHIGRKQAIGIGLESTAGTQVNADYWLPKMSGALERDITKAKDTGGYGVIDVNYDSQTVKEKTMLTIDGIVREQFIGCLLKGVFGSESISGAGPTYVHAFTRLNTNNHPTYTLWSYDPVQSLSSTYAMINNFSITAEVGDFIKYNVEFWGQKSSSQSTPTVTYVSDNAFRARDAFLYLADTEVGLDGASATNVTRVTVNFNKNLEEYQALGSEDITALFNKGFEVTGDFDALYDATTLVDLVEASTKKYMRLELINTDVDLGSGVNPTLTIDFGKVSLETRDQSSDNDGLITQTIGFTAEYNNDDAYTVKADLTNTVSTVY